VTGPFVGFSDTWQLVINTGTTIVTFLMVFLVQRAQNKESLAIQAKLDELIASQPGAWNHLIKLEDCSEDDIQALRQRFDALAQRLERAADECDSHSIVEAKDTVNEPAQPLAKLAEVHRS
jgi:low affinity Fe/Cu permease